MKAFKILLPCLFLVLAACSQPQTKDSAKPNEETETQTTSEPAKTSNPTAESPQPTAQPASEEPLTVSFDCVELSSIEDERGPQVIVSLVVNGTTTVIDTVTAARPYEPSNFAQYDIPENALAACGGWFAGGGDYFYVSQENGKLEVMVGWQDEGQDDDGFHYEPKQSITLDGSNQ